MSRVASQGSASIDEKLHLLRKFILFFLQ